jgi:hypothetical protein
MGTARAVTVFHVTNSGVAAASHDHSVTIGD